MTSSQYPNVIIKGDYDGEGEFKYKSFVSGDYAELKTPAVALTLSELVAQNPTMPLLEDPNNANHLCYWYLR